MAGGSSGDSGLGSSTGGSSSVQRSHAGDSIFWRSSVQVENGTPSTSPPYWDITDDDDNALLKLSLVIGLKPSELYGKYTWKIEKFSQINKRELRSNAFEVGGYKWYILIYPQGCDVCNHLSLFLCVANHDKLLPGWSHFAQFTIAVVNKDPKKSKYSDTLHRFWKKEHDWGWKKFMELSKVFDGFIDSDTLIIKAQVQVIRERADRPFRCLDCQYRRELIRVYMTSVEQTCRRFVEERRGKLGRLIGDKARWTSFCAFWVGVDEISRRRMSREKSDVILKLVVKHFFIEKEVTSTLVMDSLYSGLKALEGQKWERATAPKSQSKGEREAATESQSKTRKSIAKQSKPPFLVEFIEGFSPIVRAEKGMFVLWNDPIRLLEMAALEPLPPKDEKGPQNRAKDGNSGDDFNKDSIERDERRLTELGRRTVEVFVLTHILSNKVEVAYQEAIALKRQEELIREEEAAWLAENEQKAKRGAAEKEKKSKKKQAKQKRNNQKDKGRNEKTNAVLNEHQEESSGVEKVDPVEEKLVDEKPDDLSDSMNGVAEALSPDSEDRDVNPINSDTDASEIHLATELSGSGVSGPSSIANGLAERKGGPHLMDDSSSTCSTDSVPSVVLNGPYKGNSSSSNHQNKISSNRGKNQRSKVSSDATSWGNGRENQPSGSTLDRRDQNDVSETSRGAESETAATVTQLQDQKRLNLLKKDEVAQQKKQNIKVAIDVEHRPLKENKPAVSSSPQSPTNPPPSNNYNTHQFNSESSNVPALDHTRQFNSGSRNVPGPDSDPVGKMASNSLQETDRSAYPSSVPQVTGVSKSGIHQKAVSPSPRPPEKPSAQQVPVMPRPEKPSAQQVPVISRPEKPSAQQVPVMSRPSSAPLFPGPRPIAPVISMVQTTPLLARSVSAVGRLGTDPGHGYLPQSYRNAIIGNPVGPSSGVNPSLVFSQPLTISSAPMFLPQNAERIDTSSVQSGFSFGMAGPQWVESSNLQGDQSLINDIQNLNLYNNIPLLPTSTSGRQAHGGLVDDFPHLDIINDLLDEEYSSGNSAFSGSQPLMRQFSFPGDVSMSDHMMGSSSNGSCRFERTQSYHSGDVFQRGYSPAANSHFESLREYNIPQGSPLPYMNGQVDGLIQNHWPMAGPDLDMLGMRNHAEGDCYLYLNPEYANLAGGIKGYTLFRPSNGH
ncbi:hypothetical protein ACFE04_006318 [Oxalis oulophora]